MYLIKKTVLIKNFLSKSAEASINSIKVMDVSVAFVHTYQQELQLS